jgi:pectate lyase
MHTLIQRNVSALLLLFMVSGLMAAEQRRKVPAFPGAEGFGGYATGGRGGTVYAVTTLDDAGVGSLRDAVSQSNRIVVFRVSGTIDLKSPLELKRANITIAGQTAPGDGICLKGCGTYIAANDVIVRHLRCRPGDERKEVHDGLSISGGKRIILDHCSVSWAVDETVSVTGQSTDNVTIQWCFITESLNDSVHPQGPHGMGSLLRMQNGHLSMHHNLYAHHQTRNPSAVTYKGKTMVLDFRNNVVYDWGGHPGTGGKAGNLVRMNYIGNFFRSGTSTLEQRRDWAFFGWSKDTMVFQAQNLINGKDIGWSMFQRVYSKAPQAFQVESVHTDSAEAAFERVLADGGATRPRRDPVDARIVSQVREKTGAIIDSQREVGGWPALKSATPPQDSDQDGMPDAWERRQGFQPRDPTDANRDRDGDGYTNVEEFLNETQP